MKIEQMTLVQLNDIFKDVQRIGTKYPKVAEEYSDNYDGEKDQGAEGVKTLIYDLNKLKQGLFLKLEIHNDSYGNREWVSSIQFVKPVIKSVTDYVAI